MAICYKDGEKMVFQEAVCPVGWSDAPPEPEKTLTIKEAKEVVKKKSKKAE